MLYIIHKVPWESKPPKDSSSLAFQTFYWTKAFCYILRAKFPRKEYRHFVIHRINLWSPSWCTVCMMTEYLIKWIYNTGNYNTRMITVKSCVYARCTSPKINNNFDLWRLGVNTEDKTMTKTRNPSFRRSSIRVTHNRICQNRIFFFKLEFDITLGLEWSHPIVHVWEKILRGLELDFEILDISLSRCLCLLKLKFPPQAVQKFQKDEQTMATFTWW